MKPSIFVTRTLSRQVMQKLESEFDLEVNKENRNLDKQELIAAAKDKEVLLCMLTDKIDREVLENLPKLQVISNHAVGYDNIDLEAATARGIPVGITPGVLTEATADLTWAMLLGIARRIIEADRFVREGRFHGWDPRLFLGADVYGKTLGIVGMGRIGQAVARRATGFEMRVLYTKNSALPREKQTSGSERVDLQTLLRESDFVSLHLPLRQEVRHLISWQELKTMQKSAFLINTARGAIINEDDLLQALQQEVIAGAALDVYEFEPHITKGLEELNNVVLLPHLGSATFSSRIKMGKLAVENALALIRGKKPHALANPEVLQSS